MSGRDGDRAERLSALLLLAAVALAAQLARVDLAGAVAALDARELHAQRLEATLRQTERDGRGLDRIQLDATLGEARPSAGSPATEPPR